MPIDPRPHRGAVFEQEEEAEERERQTKGNRCDPLDAVEDALSQCRDDLRNILLDARLGARGAGFVHAHALQPAFALVRRTLGVLLDVRGLRADAADYDDAYEHGERRQTEQDDSGGTDARP